MMRFDRIILLSSVLIFCVYHVATEICRFAPLTGNGQWTQCFTPLSRVQRLSLSSMVALVFCKDVRLASAVIQDIQS